MKKIFIPIIIIITLGVIFGFSQLKKADNEYLIALNGASFKEKISNKDSFILLVVQTGCGYCEEFKPIMNSVAKEYNLDIYILNLAELNKEEKSYLNEVAATNSTPTTLFIVDGAEETTLNRLVGKVNKSTLVKRLKALNYIEDEG